MPNRRFGPDLRDARNRPAAALSGTITWSNTSQNITADSDVVNVGESAYAYDWNVTNVLVNGSVTSVNGVGFTATNSVGSVDENNDLTMNILSGNAGPYFGTGSAPYSNLPQEYQNILSGADTPTPAAFRRSPSTTSLPATSTPRRFGATTRAVRPPRGDPQQQRREQRFANLWFDRQRHPRPAPGQYNTGYFIANASTQQFTLTGANGYSPQVNALQLRDVTGVWSGAVNGTWDGSTANFTNNNSFSALQGVGANNIYFADTDGFGNAVPGTSTTVTVGTGVTPIATLNFQNNSLNYTLNGSLTITGTSALVKTGTGTVILNGANAYTGQTTITAGSVQLGNAGAIGSGGLSMSGGTLDLNGNAPPSIGGLSGAAEPSPTAARASRPQP